ncbi:aminopeptidase P family N-terminal domain-containing protein, partial [Desulfovibrio sp. 1188_IL3213]
MKQIYAARREELRRAMRRRGLDALLVSQAANRFYLSGFELHDPQYNESAGRLVITADGRDWLATDPRYLDAAVRLWDAERVFIYGGYAAKDIYRLLRGCGGRIGIEAQGTSLAF